MSRKGPALRCANCGFNMYNGSCATAELSPRALSILQQWNPLHELEESRLCRECCGLLWSLERGDGEPGARQLGHAHVCRCCGRSLLREQRLYSLEARRDTPDTARVLDEIKSTTPLFEHLKTVCRTCYRRAERAVKKATVADDVTEQIAEESEEQNGENSTERDETAMDQSKETETQIVAKTAETPHVTLTNYRRLRVRRATSERCAAAGCGGQAAAAPLAARRRAMRALRLYLPGPVRLCREHAGPAADLRPLLRGGLSHTFTGEQAADALFLMKPAPPPLDADDAANADEGLRRVWLGVSREEFLALRLAHPSTSQRALAVRLCARHTGECPAVLASLFQLPLEEVYEALRDAERSETAGDETGAKATAVGED